MTVKKKTIVAVSGGFDPLHIGHVRLFNAAKKLGHELVVILNNDNWLRSKKTYLFMPQRERKEIIEALRPVDRVVLSNHGPRPRDMSVAKEILALRPDIFANGGDRRPGNLRPAESIACAKIGCREVFNVGRGGKIQSSSRLVIRAARSYVQKNSRHPKK